MIQTFSPDEASAEILRRKKMRESLVGFAESIQIPGAPMSDEGDVEFELHAGQDYAVRTTLNEIDELSINIENWAKKKAITKAVQSEYGHIFAPLGSGLALHHRVLLEKIQKCMETSYGRLMVFMPPGSAKSTYATVLAPTWAMGVNPGLQVILASYATPIAKKLGSRGRFICSQPAYQGAFGTTLDPKSQAKEMWGLTNDSQYMSGGLLSGLTGNRAGGVIIDDPVKGRQAAESKTERASTLDAFEDDLTTRMIPGAWQILIQCLAGETPVLMSDGSEKRIDDVHAGYYVASFDSGRVVSARVVGQKLSGIDSVYRITTTCGKIVRGNGRHPFLVQKPEGKKWIMLKELAQGDLIVSLKDATTKQEQKPSQESVIPAKHATCSAEKTLMHRDTLSGIMVNGLGSFVSKQAAKILFLAWGFAPAIMQKIDGERVSEAQATLTKLRGDLQKSSTDTESQKKNTRSWKFVKTACALFVKKVQMIEAPAIGLAGWPWTIATTPESSEGCCVIPAILPLGGSTPKINLSQQSGISDFETSEILKIEPDGKEPVYDLQIEGTENFIAAGLVAHNTRWNEEDLAGSILPEDYHGQSGPVMCRDGMVWEVLNIPGKAEHEDDPLGRKVGEYLWPEWFDENFWKMYEPRPGDPESPSDRRWSALFQQRPKAETGNMFNEADFNRFELGAEPGGLNLYSSSDYATLEDEGDFTEHGVAGLDSKEDLWIVDWFYGQVSTDIGIDELLKLCKKWNVRQGFGETGIIRQAIEPAFKTAKRRASVPLSIEYLPTAGRKTTKALSFQSMSRSGKVWIPRCPWGDRLIDQLCSFPGRSHDDAVDVCALFGRALANMRWTQAKVVRQRKAGLTFGSWEWLTHGTDGEKEVSQDRVF